MFASQSPSTTRVLIADDHQLVLDVIGLFIASQPDFEVSFAKSFDEAYQNLSEIDLVNVMLLDAQMPGMEGILSFERMVRAFPETATVVFSGVATEQFVQEALEVGAKGYIPKTLPLKSLLTTIKLVASGEIFVPSSFATSLANGTENETYGLSKQEMNVLRLVCAGFSNKEIARELVTTEVLIKMHMRSVCKRLGAKNRTQAAVIALREQLI